MVPRIWLERRANPRVDARIVEQLTTPDFIEQMSRVSTLPSSGVVPQVTAAAATHR